MNPLDQALTLGLQAAEDGFDWKDPLLALEKVREEVEELREALENGSPEPILDELGDVFFSLVQVARLAGVDSAQALHFANQKFIRRYTGMQELAENQQLKGLTIDQQMQLWQRVKVSTSL
jgi:ATP diphosphatase